jgi:hypothetical protein
MACEADQIICRTPQIWGFRISVGTDPETADESTLAIDRRRRIVNDSAFIVHSLISKLGSDFWRIWHESRFKDTWNFQRTLPVTVKIGLSVCGATRTCTGSLHIDVVTLCPLHWTARGSTQ